MVMTAGMVFNQCGEGLDFPLDIPALLVSFQEVETSVYWVQNSFWTVTGIRPRARGAAR